MAKETRILPTDQLVSDPSKASGPVQSVPSATWSMLSNQVRTEPLPKNIDAMYDTIKGYIGRLRHRTGHYMGRAKRVLAYEKDFLHVTDADLHAAALDYRAMFRTGRDKPEDLL